MFSAAHVVISLKVHGSGQIRDFLNYALFALVIVHAFFYGALLRKTSPYTILLGLIVIAVVAGQSLGVWLYRRRYARRTVESASALASGR